MTDPEVHDDLVWLLGHAPNLVVVVATPTVSSLESASVRVRLNVNVVPPEALLFTVAEISEMLASENLDPSLAEELDRSVGPLPLMVRAVVLSLSRHGAESGTIDTSERLDTAGTDIVRELILDAGGGTDRSLDFLMKISLAGDTTVELAQRMAGLTQSRELLFAAENSGLGVRSDGGRGHCASPRRLPWRGRPTWGFSGTEVPWVPLSGPSVSGRSVAQRGAIGSGT